MSRNIELTGVLCDDLQTIYEHLCTMSPPYVEAPEGGFSNFDKEYLRGSLEYTEETLVKLLGDFKRHTKEISRVNAEIVTILDKYK